MNKAMTLLAEDLGFSFVLSPVKYRGFGGPTEQWDYALESFEVMAALAEATDRIQLYGSVALPTVHPAITARRAATIDHISQGRFGINLVSGWQKEEYAQMGLWPGDVHYQRRYQYAREYVDILKLLWSQRDVDYDGEFFHLRDCRILPHPERPLPLVCAGQSDVGMQFTAQHADYAFVLGDLSGDAVFAANRKLQQYADETGRDVGAYVLYTLVLGGDRGRGAGQVRPLDGARRSRGARHDDGPGGARCGRGDGRGAAGRRLYRDYADHRLVRAVRRDSRPHRHGARDQGDHAHLPGVPGGAPGVRRAGAAAHAHGQAGTPAGAAGAGLMKE